MTRGSRNLLILVLSVVSFAIANTAFGLAYYHRSGDIYLDRSRPGFLPDEDENQNNPQEDNYTFPESGSIKAEDLTEFLQHYNAELDHLKSLGDPFSADPLSDESLGIEVKE